MPGRSVILLFNKPFRVLSQFTDSEGRATLADFIDQPGVYPAGRLDYDSEGLLLLTDDGGLKAALTDPRSKTPKTYWVQIEGRPRVADLERLERGVRLKEGPTAPARVELMAQAPPGLWKRQPPIAPRPGRPTSWISLTITEGRNRQVRRMTAAVGLPTLCLIRCRVGDFTLDGLAPGELRQLPAQ
jgi:23S rRNA pseudouridine2457 synthase